MRADHDGFVLGRKRKTACSGERPTCDTCTQNKLECAGYTTDPAAPGHKRTTSDASRRRTSDGNDTDERPRKLAFQSRHIKQESDVDPSLRNSSNIQYDGCPPPPPPIQWTTSNASAGGLSPGITPAGRQPASEAVADDQDQESLFSGPGNRMPYFRWLGPTAIMPGFKQMVVKVKRQDTDMGRSSTNGDAGVGGIMSPSLNGLDGANHRVPSIYSATPAAVESDVRTPLNLPFYDTSPMPPSELITHLADCFFTHLGCNYPFLQRERFLRDLEEKQVDAILVDAVCALAARFSTHTLLTEQSNDVNKATPPEYGHAFAQRAKTALVDTFACPSVAAVQAALLLAYNEFGESRDSGLWMYLGISIRMAQDLGLHQRAGLKYKGKSGPTPKMIKRESMSDSPELQTKLVGGEKMKKKKDERDETPREKVVHESAEMMVEARDQADEQHEVDEQKAVEQERVDTFWAVFFLDRVVSSGTGRRSTLRDKDIELSFPALDGTDPKSGWPAPFPALIRIVHLYGRVADLLNSIKEPSDITTETPKRLASMESQVTNFYQGLSPRLHFDAVNFQHYMKAGEGTNFVLLHFWFHTLIVLLHQPTLLKTFEGRMLQLFPNSQQLSMSSAKTIADILSYSQLMDAKASLGNPFTTQPIYIAACAFLKETAEQSATSNAQSRASSPSRKEKGSGGDSRPPSMNGTPTQGQAKRMSISELSNHSNATNVNSGSTPNGGPQRSSSMITEQHKSSDQSSGEHSALSAAKTASALAKHTLLATAASQHYQLCYKALQSLETYWAGTKYILTVLEQKFAGVGDPLLYTVEEGESAMEKPRPEPAFTSPGWRRKLSWGPYMYGTSMGMQGDFWMDKAGQMHGSPSGDVSKGQSSLRHKIGIGSELTFYLAIGWTLTGTMNSPSTNLAWHYPSGAGGDDGPAQQQQQQQPLQQKPSVPKFNPMTSPAEYEPSSAHSMQFPRHLRAASSNAHQPPALTGYPTNGSAVSSHDAADLLLNLDSPYQTSTNASHPTGSTGTPGGPFNLHQPPTTATNDMNNTPHNGFTSDAGVANIDSSVGSGFASWNYPNLWNPNNPAMQHFGDMMIESQDVDMSMLGLDMMPWFDSYPTHDMAGLFDPGGGGPADADPSSAGAGAGAQVIPQG